jgi:acyl-coenzyme A synthetase/AMP-(fatty) acid ligase
MLFPHTLDSVIPPIYEQIFLVIKRYGVRYAWRVLKALKMPIINYSSLPPYTGGGTMGVIGSFIGGSVKVHKDRFSPIKLLELIEKEKVTGLSLPPALGMMLIRYPNFGKYDLSSLMYVALVAAPVPPSLIDEFKARLGCPVLNTFGATEMFGGPTILSPFTDPNAILRESIGKVRHGYETRVVDEDRKPVPAGEVGELAVRTGVQMLGYYKADELNQKTFDEEGWYYTGDQATMDEDGYIRIVGRIKDMIIRGGQNIYPAELEDLLVTHPKVGQAAVIGIPDPIAGEKVLGYIIPAPETSPTRIEILNFCRENLAPYKVPANVCFVDAFPLNATGKVLKRVLREEAISEFWLKNDQKASS